MREAGHEEQRTQRATQCSRDAEPPEIGAAQRRLRAPAANTSVDRQADAGAKIEEAREHLRRDRRQEYLRERGTRAEECRGCQREVCATGMCCLQSGRGATHMLTYD